MIFFCYFKPENVGPFIGGLIVLFLWLLYLFLILGTAADNL